MATSGTSLVGLASSSLFTLGARAAETLRPDAIVRDPVAVELVRRIAWPFHEYAGDWMTQVAVAVRTEILDQAVAHFMRRRPDARIVNLGAGFCSRGIRLGSAVLDWVDVDVPDVVELKRSLLPERPGYRHRAASILDPVWIDEIATATPRPTLFVAEGVLQYLESTDVRRLLSLLALRFPGAEMLLEVVSPLAVRLARWSPSLTRAGVRPRWGLTDPGRLAAWANGASVVATWSYDRHLRRWGWIGPLARAPAVRRLMRIVHLRLPPPVPSGAE